MDQLFNPKSVVVIGVSETPTTSPDTSPKISSNLSFMERSFDREKEGILLEGNLYSIEDPEGIDVAVILTLLHRTGILEAVEGKDSLGHHRIRRV